MTDVRILATDKQADKQANRWTEPTRKGALAVAGGNLINNSIEFYKYYDTLPISLLHNYYIMLFVHKCIHQTSTYMPDIFMLYFTQNKLSFIHSYDDSDVDSTDCSDFIPGSKVVCNSMIFKWLLAKEH